MTAGDPTWTQALDEAIRRVEGLEVDIGHSSWGEGYQEGQTDMKQSVLTILHGIKAAGV